MFPGIFVHDLCRRSHFNTTYISKVGVGRCLEFQTTSMLLRELVIYKLLTSQLLHGLVKAADFLLIGQYQSRAKYSAFAIGELISQRHAPKTTRFRFSSLPVPVRQSTAAGNRPEVELHPLTKFKLSMGVVT